MTLLDAPVFNEAKARRNWTMLWSSVAAVFVLLVAGWFVSGRPVDWPWNWPNHLLGRMEANHFLEAVERNDLEGRIRHLDARQGLEAAPFAAHGLSLLAFRGGLGHDEPGERIRRDLVAPDCGGAHVRQHAADGNPHQRPQEQGTEPGV